jgi:hypothetical protein
MFDVNETSRALAEVLCQASVVSRRNLLRKATIIAGGAAVLAGAISATHAEAEVVKIQQAAAGYQTTPKNGQSCADCTHFIAPSSCKLVDGTISSAGWCKLFAAKS